MTRTSLLRAAMTALRLGFPPRRASQLRRVPHHQTGQGQQTSALVTRLPVVVPGRKRRRREPRLGDPGSTVAKDEPEAAVSKLFSSRAVRRGTRLNRSAAWLRTSRT